MKIQLKLGVITAKEFADCIGAKLYSCSSNANENEIALLTNDIVEISQKSLFIVSEDNSLAEMMAAAKNGAYTVLCTKAPDALEKIPDSAVIVCENVNDALEKFAKYYAKRKSYRTIALTGSNGKTRTGEFIYSILGEMYKVYKVTDKKSNEKNDALALLDMPADADFFLVELKIREKKDITRLANIFNCDVGIITSAGSENEKKANVGVLSGIKEGGEILFTADDDIPALICRSDVKKTSVSATLDSAEFHASRIRTRGDRTVFDIVGENILIKDVEIRFTGEDNIKSALFAALVGVKYGIPEEKIRFGLINYHSAELGAEIYTLGGITFFLDTSSATYDSVKKGIDTLCDIAQVHKKSRKILLIGDIRDFGQDTRKLHEQMGAYIAEKKIDKLFTFGVAAEHIGIGACRAGMDEKNIFGNLELFSPLKSAEAVEKVLSQGDILFIRIGRQGAAQEIEQYLRQRFEK